MRYIHEGGGLCTPGQAVSCRGQKAQSKRCKWDGLQILLHIDISCVIKVFISLHVTLNCTIDNEILVDIHVFYSIIEEINTNVRGTMH